MESLFQFLHTLDPLMLFALSGATVLDISLKIGAVIASMYCSFFLLRVFAFGPFVIMQISADGTKGLMNQVRSAIHYLYNVDKLKRLYIRDGKISDKPVYLVRSPEDTPDKHD